MTPRQIRFVTEYLVDYNATRAAIRAGYSERNADKIGPKVSRKPAVAAAIQAGLAEAAKRRQEAREAADSVRGW
jgi:phage terminase small subunit